MNKQWCGNDERHPVVSEPRGSNPLDVAVRGLKGQSRERLSQHDREEYCAQSSGDTHPV